MTIPPPLVPPSLDKIDLQRLLSDLPKYKPWISAQSWVHWEQFIKSSSTLGEVQAIPWMFNRLKESAAEAEEIRKTQTRPTVQADTAAMLSKDTAPIPQVIMCF